MIKKNQVVLGIHIGHDASCAITINGKLKAGIQQERITRIKHDGCFGLSNRLPIKECLELAGLKLSDVDYIISCFQAVAPGGIGLQNSLIENDFSLFDPYDYRHYVISHHLAHASCAVATSGLNNSAILVIDLGGSSTFSGEDFFLPFSEWHSSLKSHTSTSVLTENCSLYDYNDDSFELKKREFCVPHSCPDIFIHSLASLYENVSHYIFQAPNSHGQLMALSSIKSLDKSLYLTSDDILIIDSQDQIIFKNDWQDKIKKYDDPLHYYYVANAVQKAFENGVLAYVRQSRKLSKSDNLCVAGGIFYNIIVNSKIVSSKHFKNYFIPSAPNDAGISIGCAYYGHLKLVSINKLSTSSFSYIDNFNTDRIGGEISEKAIKKELSAVSDFVDINPLDETAIAAALVQGKIIARCAGKAEFGARALGGRSLLASPLLESSKQRLNKIKNRQAWRPVAPIVTAPDLARYFIGRYNSYYMSFAHYIRNNYQDKLLALFHPDNSTRAQALLEEDDPSLYRILKAFEIISGYPILVNTSFNGKGMPIVNFPKEVVNFFLSQNDIDILLVNSLVITKKEYIKEEDVLDKEMKLSKNTVLNLEITDGRISTFVCQDGKSIKVSLDLFDELSSLGKAKLANDLFKKKYKNELYQLIKLGIIEYVK